MIATLSDYVNSDGALPTRSYLLLQRSTPEAEADLLQKLPGFVTLKAIPSGYRCRALAISFWPMTLQEKTSDRTISWAFLTTIAGSRPEALNT